MTTKEEIAAVAESMGLTMTAEFVPWSKSRNAGEKLPSLNWKVTLHKDGRPILTTDYMAGSGHCPAYKASVKELGNQKSIMRDEAIRYECEHGVKASVIARYPFPPSAEKGGANALKPELADVLHSLASDSDVLDYSNFEEWAENFGYDPDSRKGEGVYRACLEIALKLRNVLGESGLATLREATQDY